MGKGQFEAAAGNDYIKDPRGFSHFVDDTRSAPEKECSREGAMSFERRYDGLKE